MNNGTIAAEAELFLDFMSAKERCGPKRPLGPWQGMSVSDQEDHFVYLRIALEHADLKGEISEDARNFLLLQYLELFRHLASIDSKLSAALKQKTHRFYRPNDKVFMRAQERLVPDYDRA